MNRTAVFEPQQEIAALKRRVEQLERALENMQQPWPAYGKWCPPQHIGDPYYLNAPQAKQ